MKIIKISSDFQEGAPQYKGAAVSCRVTNSVSDVKLWKEMELEFFLFHQTTAVEQINKRLPIAATRAAYKAFGKDPNRYRPSAEALCRRIVKEKSLYRIDTLVDLINLVSVHTGYSIGGFDEEKIQGDILELGVGKAGEIFHGIGRGGLNIEGLPVFRDSQGGIGTPTSDEERTKITLGTTRLLTIINGYSGSDGLKDAVSYLNERLCCYAAAEDFECLYF